MVVADGFRGVQCKCLFPSFFASSRRVAMASGDRGYIIIHVRTPSCISSSHPTVVGRGFHNQA